MPDRILIVADDLTGACDAAAAFVAKGRTVRVFPAVTNADVTVDAAEVIAVTTESRDLAADQAGQRVAETIQGLWPSFPEALLFKKIDSAARGPFAAEVEAALIASRASLALITPAFPATGRTVMNGVLSIRDSIGQNMEVVLRDLFAATSAQHLAILPISSEAGLRGGLAQAIGNKVRILLCDAIMQMDLDRLAAAALSIAEPILWAGSAGLAQALSARLLDVLSPSHRFPPVSRRAGRAILFTGSPHAVTALQVAHLEGTAYDEGLHSLSIHRVAKAGACREEVVSAFRSQSPAALILTGGDTAGFVLRALNARAIRLAGEIAPGIPWGIVEGGLADRCAVITKSGGFGERDALVRAFEFCETEFCESEV